MPETEHSPTLPSHREILNHYEQAFADYQQQPSSITQQNWISAADMVDAAVLMLPGRLTLGQIGATPGALTALERAEHLPGEFLLRHKSGDSGDLDPHDLQANEDALAHRGRIVSVYRTRQNENLWVITDAGWEVTTLLLPEEY